MQWVIQVLFFGRSGLNAPKLCLPVTMLHMGHIKVMADSMIAAPLAVQSTVQPRHKHSSNCAPMQELGLNLESYCA